MNNTDSEKLISAAMQATTCARCGEYKHTPIRDSEDGYICASCLEKERDTLREQLAQVTAERDEAKKQVTDIIPDNCPITGAPFFMLIETPEGRTVPTYGGPYDSYTIPEFEGTKGKPLHERECHQERYDHDEGGWVDGGECITLRLIAEDTIFQWDDERAQLRAENDRLKTALANGQLPTPHDFR